VKLLNGPKEGDLEVTLEPPESRLEATARRDTLTIRAGDDAAGETVVTVKAGTEEARVTIKVEGGGGSKSRGLRVTQLGVCEARPPHPSGSLRSPRRTGHRRPRRRANRGRSRSIHNSRPHRLLGTMPEREEG